MTSTASFTHSVLRHATGPRPRKPQSHRSSPTFPSSLQAIQSAQHVLEMFRRTLTETDSASAVLDRMLNRLTKIAAELRKLTTQ